MEDKGQHFIGIETRGLFHTSIRVGMKQPCYLGWYKSARGTAEELHAHKSLGEPVFLNRWYWGYWLPRIRISTKDITRFDIKWLVFGFSIDKY